MYHFNKPTKAVAREIKKAYDTLDASGKRVINLQYQLFTGNVAYTIGILYVEIGYNGLYSEPYINVLAELDTDKGRNNTIGLESFDVADIAFAIGFTCGAAMFRVPHYRY